MTRSPAEAPGAARPSTAVDAIAERYVARLAGLFSEFAVYNGLPDRRGELDDYSPAGLAARKRPGLLHLARAGRRRGGRRRRPNSNII